MKLITNLVLQTVTVGLLAPTAALTAAVPQRQPPPSDREAMNRELLERSRALDTAEKMARTPPPARPEPPLDLARIEEDYLRIQEVANGLHKAAAHGGALDLKFVSESASEIRERATRLGSNLALPKPEKAKKGSKRPETELIADEDGLRRALLALHESVYRFARSPVFTEVNVVDAELSLKARRDLEEIIELSGRVKEGSEGLEKSARRGKGK